MPARTFLQDRQPFLPAGMEEDVKPIYGAIAVTAGFVASLGMFAVGAGTAAYFIAVEPGHKPGPSVDVADLWTATPRPVGDRAQDLERLPPRVAAPQLEPATAPASDGQYAVLPQQAADAPAGIDPATTASLPAAQPDQPPIDILSQHVAWCFDRYRSYRVGDDSYTPYAGGRRPCVSPWSEELAAWAEGASPGLATGYEDDAGFAGDEDLEARYQHAMDDDGLGGPIVRGAEAGELLYAADDSGFGLSEAHISNCFARYRSYRPEDNSYQPYGGGPRRQCR